MTSKCSVGDTDYCRLCQDDVQTGTVENLLCKCPTICGERHGEANYVQSAFILQHYDSSHSGISWKSTRTKNNTLKLFFPLLYPPP